MTRHYVSPNALKLYAKMLYQLFQTIRPKTLLVSFSVILLGQLLAWHDLTAQPNQPSLNPFISVVCLFCCLFLQIAVNLANDYFDHLSGVDSSNRQGPQRILQTGAMTLKTLKLSIATCTLLATISGSYLIFLGGWVFFALGLLSIMGIFLYSGSRYSLASRSLGEIAVFLFFGWLGVIGSYYLQVEELNGYLFMSASELGALIAAIMLVNNIRDMTSDHLAGKITLAYRLGPIYSRHVYGILILFPFLSLIFNPYSPWLNAFLLPLHLCMYFLIFKRSGPQLNIQLAHSSLLVLTWTLGYLCSLVGTKWS